MFIYVSNLSFHISATYGIVVHDDYQGKGLGSILMSYIMSYGKRLGLNKITLTVNTANERTIKLYKKFGFVIEGLHKNVDVWKNEVFDIYYMTFYLNN